MEMNYFILGIILFVGQILSSAADCSTSTPGVRTFGSECQYMCHCNDGVSCDTTTGECIQGCDSNWFGPACQYSKYIVNTGEYNVGCDTNCFGPACQYRDLAEWSYSRHNSNQKPAYFSGDAIDGNTSTCSKTKEADQSTERPWWRVRFPQNETIRDIYILTEDNYNSRRAFRSFEVTVEYVPDNKKHDQDYVPTYSHRCYKHTYSIPGNANIQVQCGGPIVGNQVRIKLPYRNYQLVLCDVRIGGGRNFAFRKSVSASHFNSNFPPANAVDGRLAQTSSTDWNGCFAASDTGNKYLDINIGHYFYTYSVNINTKNDDYIRDYQIYNASTSPTEWQLVYDDTGKTPPVTYLHLNTNVQQLRIQSNTDNLAICELEIYGECPANKCGYDCTENCFCNSYEDYEHRISGVCTTGCQERWTGSGGKCNIECDANKWGTQCQNNCGACRVGSCAVASGLCTGGCEDGYQTTTDCKTECDDGKYGFGCAKECVPRCGTTCDQVNGHCLQCPPGWKGNFCEIECNIGQYGINCAGNCGFCKVHTSCDTVTGVCPSGCIDGYTGPSCDQDIEQPIQSNTIGIIAGSVVAGIVVICVTIFAVCVVMYRRRQSPPVIKEPENLVEMSHAPTSASYEDLQQNAYMNDKEETNYETIDPE